ncbi:MAG TPA: peptidylprolyl isomerase [Kofleriaceae bacterium]|jgi:peptidyl-prolyl cis-trans isomerase A (cyclophilin A)
MRTTGFAFVAALALIAGCEHTNGKNEKKDEGGGAAPTKPADTTQTPPPSNPPPSNPPPAEKPPEPPPSTDPNALRPPVAADLETYMKAVKGDGKLVATFETNQGTIHCELFPDKTPMTVANFVGLVTGQKAWRNPKTGNVETGKPYFDGLTFHRVIPGFMIQGGDPLGQGNSGPGYQFGDEFTPDLTMKEGTLAMANAGPSTNGSQFFITDSAPDWLNGKHTIFGQCKEVDLVKKIEAVPRGAQDRPNDPVVMTKVTVGKMKSW